MALTTSEFIFPLEKTLLYHIVIDRDGKIYNVNKRSETLFQLPQEKIVGGIITNYIIDKERSLFSSTLTQCYKQEESLHNTFRFSITPDSGILTIKFDFVLHNNLIYTTGVDITEEDKEHYSLISLSKLIQTGVWHYNPINKEMFFSKECYALFELDLNTSITMEKTVHYFLPESKDKIRGYIDTLINKKPIDVVEKIITNKGNEKWVRILGEPIISNDKVIFINGSFSDITERHNYIEQLKYNEETKKLALKGIQSGLFDHHFEKNATFYSIDFKKMLGLPLKDDFINVKLFENLLHPEDLSPAIERHIKGLKKKGYQYFNYYRIRDKEGEYKHYEVHGYRKKDENGRTTRMIGNLINVHQRKLNEQIIDKDKSRLSAMVNNSFAYTVLLNNQGEILMADDASLHIINRDFGINPREVSCNFIDVMPVNFKNSFAYAFNEAKKGKIVKTEIERITKKGAVQWLDTKYTPIYNSSNNIHSILICFHDISELKTAELAIKEAHLKEQELSGLKSNILSNFSHEIRTPLNGIITICNMLLSGDENPDERDKLSVYLEESKDRLLATINNLSNYSELETIKNNLTFSEVDINYLVETSYREYRHMAKSKKIDYLLELDESCPIVNIDQDIFHTAINNIIHNAIKYTNQGKVIVAIESKKGYIHISIKDSGIGIKEDNIKKIFDPFIQESIGLSRKYEGTGIGLSISKKYIEVLGGKINVVSKANQGTNFIIIIPKNT